MRNHAGVARRQLRTSNYTAEARNRLGEAVEAARLAAGYKFRTEFVRAHGIKNLRGLELLEQGQTGVGQAFLFEVARALPGWDEDTPRAILEGADPPPLSDRPSMPGIASDDEGWTEEDEELHQALTALLAAHGLKPTAATINAMRAEWERERAERGESDEAGHA
jgi:hypothetical protein